MIPLIIWKLPIDRLVTRLKLMVEEIAKKVADFVWSNLLPLILVWLYDRWFFGLLNTNLNEIHAQRVREDVYRLIKALPAPGNY